MGLPLHDPVRRHLAAAGDMGDAALRLAERKNCNISWSCLAYPPEVAAFGIAFAIHTRWPDEPLPRVLADVLALKGLDTP
jgi:hypothetical protein